MAQQGKSYYNDKFLYLEDFSSEVLPNTLEFSRLCIHPDHRTGEIFFLVAEAYKYFMKYFRKLYLFASVSIFCQKLPRSNDNLQFF
ncbi:GNAT family N-acyltransferase [Candidatus Coxiella mudrowiae]|uniref:GNAT family N-acyltransferase n=1 Tax=Candidatus Coxiella mudrowiae TaxID=2054173 RepID=UPI000C285A38